MLLTLKNRSDCLISRLCKAHGCLKPYELAILSTKHDKTH